MRRIFIWIIMISAVVLAGCDVFERVEKPADRVALLNDAHMTFGPAADSLKSYLITNTDWVATSDSPWCRVEPSSGGSGNSEIIFLVSESNDVNPRAAKLTFVAGTASIDVNVVQTGVSMLTLSITHEADMLRSPVFEGLIKGLVYWGDGEKSDIGSAGSHEYKEEGIKTAKFEFTADKEILQVEINGINGIKRIDFSGLR
jgi:hypothetical protein